MVAAFRFSQECVISVDRNTKLPLDYAFVFSIPTFDARFLGVQIKYNRIATCITFENQKNTTI